MQQQNATQLLQRLLKVKQYSTGTPGHSFTSTVPLNIHSQVLMFSRPLLRREPECSCLSKLHIHSSYAQGISAHISPACSDFSRVCLILLCTPSCSRCSRLQPQTGQGCSRSRPKPSCPSLQQTSTRLQGRVDWSGCMQKNVWRGGG
jgi:hypothetical protein